MTETLAKIEEALKEAVELAVDEVDYSKHIEDAVNDYDLDEAIKNAVRYYDFGDAIEEACGDYDFTDVLESPAQDAIEEAMQNINLEKKIDDYLDEVIPNKVKQVFLDLLDDKDFMAKLTTALFTQSE